MNALRMRCLLISAAIVSATAPMAVADAQTYFSQTVIHQAVPVFANLATIESPASTTSSGTRTLMIKLLTNNLGAGTAGPLFQIYRVSTGQAALVQADQPADLDDAISDPLTGNTVASASAVTAAGPAPCPTTTVESTYKMICLTVQFDELYVFPATAETWQVNVQQHTTTDFDYFGFKTNTLQTDQAAAEVLVTAPRLSAQTTLDFGGVQRNINLANAPILPVTVRNLGTAPVGVSGGTIAPTMSPFSTSVFIVGAIDPATSTFVLSIHPGGSMVNDRPANRGIYIQVRPTALGAQTATLNLTGSPSGTASINLSVTGITFYGHLLLDCSGSMSWSVSGQDGVAEEQSRFFLAKQPARQINNWVHGFGDGAGYLGLSTFPACRAGDWVPVEIDVTLTTQPVISTMLAAISAGGITPDGLTPMQTGIEQAVADMNNRITNTSLPPNEADRPNLRQAIVMLSDGYQYPTGTSNAAATIPSLVTSGIRMYTIGYGVLGTNDVDHALLQQLASGTSGQFWDANALDEFALRDAFKNAVREWLMLESLVDPTGVIRGGQSRQHKVCVDERAYGLTFVTNWDRDAPGGINFTLVSPTGEVITSSTSGVRFFGDRMFAQYVIRGDRVRGGAGAGEWTLNLTGASIPNNQDTRYSYSAMAQTSVRVEPTRGVNIWTGLQHLVEVKLVNWPGPAPVVGTGPTPAPGPTPVPVSPRVQPVITVHYELPVSSYGTWLATNKVEREWFFSAQPPPVRQAGFSLVRSLFAQSRQDSATQAPATIMGEPATIAQRKAWAIANIGKRPFDTTRTRDSLRLYDDGTHGDRVAYDHIYTAEAPEYRYDGLYRFRIDVKTPGRVRATCIERDINFSDIVIARLTPLLIRQNVAWHSSVKPSLFFDPSYGNGLPRGEVAQGFTRSVAKFTPKDEFGNYWGPGHASQIQFGIQNGKTLGPVIDNWDGSYLQVLEHPSNVRPTIAVVAGGVRSDPIQLSGGGAGGLPLWLWIALTILLLVVLFIWRPWA